MIFERKLHWIVAGVIAAAFPIATQNAYYLHLAETIAIYAILLIGLDVLLGYTGQVSLGHAALFGIGAYTAGILYLKTGLSLIVALPLSGLVTAIFGAVLALPSLRVSGPYLAMVTLAFGTIVQILLNEMTEVTNGPLGIKLGRPEIFGHHLDGVSYFYVVLGCLALTIVAVNRICRSHIGRAFQALRDSPIASDCMAVPVYRYKATAFIVSAVIAGTAGCLYAYSEEYISPNTYSFELTILFLLAAILGGKRSRFGSILGAAIIVVLPTLLADVSAFRLIAIGIPVGLAVYMAYARAYRGENVRPFVAPLLISLVFSVVSFGIENVTDWRLSIFGLMTLFAVYYLPDGIAGAFASRKAAAADGKTAQRKIAADTEMPGIARCDQSLGAVLETREACMQFGGLHALTNLNLNVRAGTIHGLIGPNGSGKSTTMNVLTGIYKPTTGRILFANQDVTGMSPSGLACAGIARTFQNVQLFSEMSVEENILVGLHHSFKSGIWGAIFNTPSYRHEEREARQRALQLAAFAGFGSTAQELAKNLPYGRQRILEIARALALDPKLLLLDEPAAGLTAPDIAELTGLIRKIHSFNVTILLIEHHMDVVMSLCETITVLDFGCTIAEGTPREIQRHPEVMRAYLGTGPEVEGHINKEAAC